MDNNLQPPTRATWARLPWWQRWHIFLIALVDIAFSRLRRGSQK
jgi:hypothetical protein